MAAPPKYLTGDVEGIKEFIDRFDVGTLPCGDFFPKHNSYSTFVSILLRYTNDVLTPIPGLPIRLRRCVIPPTSPVFPGHHTADISNDS